MASRLALRKRLYDFFPNLTLPFLGMMPDNRTIPARIKRLQSQGTQLNHCRTEFGRTGDKMSCFIKALFHCFHWLKKKQKKRNNTRKISYIIDWGVKITRDTKWKHWKPQRIDGTSGRKIGYPHSNTNSLFFSSRHKKNNVPTPRKLHTRSIEE